jgi:nitrilase
MLKAAVAQTGTLLFDTPATLRRVQTLCREAAAAGTQLLVFPEALLGGYPKGLTFGATLGNRTEEGRTHFLRYFQSAITLPGPETDQLAALAKELNLHIVIGVVERAATTLYCTSILLTPYRGLTTKHRKLMPTGTERLLWALGDASTMQVTETAIGRIAMAICWENYMPLYRQHLYNQNVELWCAPTVDARPQWQITMRHIAYEARCFVLSPCQYLTKEDWPEDLQANAGTIEGQSLIVAPTSDLMAPPLTTPGLLHAQIDLNEIPRARFDLDVAGHYNRPDIFTLQVK